jgi:methylase of polypeptide subunit release factors
VKTKFQKHATTFLLDIPALLEVVKWWDDEVRNVLSPTGFWFAPISPETGEIDPTISKVGYRRNVRARKDLEKLLEVCWLALSFAT